MLKTSMLHGTCAPTQIEGRIEVGLSLDGAAIIKELNDCGEMFIVGVHSHFITFFLSWRLKGC